MLAVDEPTEKPPTLLRLNSSRGLNVAYEHSHSPQGSDHAFEVEIGFESFQRAVKDAINLDSYGISAYDTAWVARIPKAIKGGRPVPHFPEALQWVERNQMADGSWGEQQPLTVFDHYFSTLSCLIALKSWGTAPQCVAKGEQYLQEGLSSFRDDELKYVSHGMKNAFAAMLEEAEKLGLAIAPAATPPCVQSLRSDRTKVLERLEKIADLIADCPKKLLSFPEGLEPVLDWEGIRELQFEDGSIFSSPAATACFVMRTKDSKALSYLTALIGRFNDAVPSMYPTPLSEVLSIVDHLERLNIDRYFSAEVKDLLDILHRQSEPDEDDNDDDSSDDIETQAMIFRALREHGYDVTPDTFLLEGISNGQVGQLGARGMLQLYRASEMIFPGELLLDYTKNITTTFLKSTLASSSDAALKKEIQDALHSPHFMQFRPLESMKYIDRFESSVEAEETYFEMTFSRLMHKLNPLMIAFSKVNFNNCQSIYQEELQTLTRWDEENLRKLYNFQRQPLLPAFLAGAVGMPDPKLSLARSVWTRGSVLVTVIDDLFDEASLHDGIQGLRLFHESIKRWDPSIVDTCCDSVKILARLLMNEVDSLCKEASEAQGRDLTPFLRTLWQDVIAEFLTEAEWNDSGYQPSSEEYLRTGAISFGLGPITLYTIFCYGEHISDDMIEDDDYLEAFDLVNQYGRLINDLRTHSREVLGGHNSFISVYQREHPKESKQEAYASVQNLLKGLASKVFSKLLNPRYSSQSVRETHLVMMRSLYLMYYEVDGYRFTTHELKKQIQRFFYKRFPSE
ncbi:hypothetical protein Mapa_000466 [Marchantia paleacea]|nr:hypothetical protein Mapa_000466 [Marchantia paleacea]